MCGRQAPLPFQVGESDWLGEREIFVEVFVCQQNVPKAFIVSGPRTFDGILVIRTDIESVCDLTKG
jgi:hypothetical protein